MKKMAYYNGEFGLADEMKIPLLDRAVFFGDGCYDAAFVIGGKALDMDAHIERFFNSMRMMEITPPVTKEELENILMELVERSGTPDGLLYWQCSRGTAPRTHCYPPADVKANLLVTIGPKGMPDVRTAVPMITVEDKRYFYCNIKTLNLIPNVFANQKAKEAGAGEAIFVRPDGTVTEGSHTNVMILKNGAIHTHPDGEYILPGISKKMLLALAREMGIPVVEEPFSKDEMMAADEVFITGSSTFLHRASSIDGQPCRMADEALYLRLALAYEERALRLTKA